MFSKSTPRNETSGTDVGTVDVKAVEDAFKGGYVSWNCIRQKMLELGFSFLGGAPSRVVLINQKVGIAVAIDKTTGEPEHCTGMSVYTLTRVSQLRVEIVRETKSR